MGFSLLRLVQKDGAWYRIVTFEASMATFTFRGATMQRVLASLLLATVACGSDSSGPTTSTLQNDDFTSGGSSATFVAGFGTGEAAAARLGPKTAAFTIRR